MKIYILNIVTSLLVAWIILVLLGMSAGFTDLIPEIALLGALLLFSVATPLLLYKSRIGLILGLIGLIAMLPYTIGFVKSVLEDGVFNWAVVLSFLPALLTLFSLYLSAKQTFVRSATSLSLPTSPFVRLILAAIPVGITLLYFIFYGKEWV